MVLEKSEIMSLRPEQAFWLPTNFFLREMSSKLAWRRHCLGFKTRFKPRKKPGLLIRGRIIPQIISTKDGPTIKFIKEISLGHEPFQTTLWQSICQGKKVSRMIGEEGNWTKQRLNEPKTFIIYADRVKQFIDMTSKNGITPAAKNEYASVLGRSGDVDIGFAILEGGIMFYRKGHHRIGCAIALGIERIPCQCYLVAEHAVNQLMKCGGSGEKLADWKQCTIEYLERMESMT